MRRCARSHGASSGGWPATFRSHLRVRSASLTVSSSGSSSPARTKRGRLSTQGHTPASSTLNSSPRRSRASTARPCSVSSLFASGTALPVDRHAHRLLVDNVAASFRFHRIEKHDGPGARAARAVETLSARGRMGCRVTDRQERSSQCSRSARRFSCAHPERIQPLRAIPASTESDGCHHTRSSETRGAAHDLSRRIAARCCVTPRHSVVPASGQR